MEFAVRGGLTRAVRHFHRTPLYVLQPIHLDEQRPEMAFVYVQHQGDGLLQGDRYRIDLAVGEDAQVHVTTQSAAKIYGMDSGYAAAQVHLVTQRGSFLEYLPEPTIPYARSRFLGETTVTVDPEATVFFAETLLPGRVARGERHDYDAYCATTCFERPGGRLLAVDALSFEPRVGTPTSPASLGKYAVTSIFFAFAPRPRLSGLSDALWAAVAGLAEVLVGVSTLPEDAGVVARVLGHSSIPVRAAVHTLWDASRRYVIGSPAPDLRRD